MSKENKQSSSKITITETALISLIIKAISEVELVKAPSRLSASRQIKLGFKPGEKKAEVFLRLAFSPAKPLIETARAVQEKVRDVLVTTAGFKVEKIEIEITHLFE